MSYSGKPCARSRAGPPNDVYRPRRVVCCGWLAQRGSGASFAPHDVPCSRSPILGPGDREITTATPARPHSHPISPPDPRARTRSTGYHRRVGNHPWPSTESTAHKINQRGQRSPLGRNEKSRLDSTPVCRTGTTSLPPSRSLVVKPISARTPSSTAEPLSRRLADATLGPPAARPNELACSENGAHDRCRSCRCAGGRHH
jgi:hypothetical protein